MFLRARVASGFKVGAQVALPDMNDIAMAQEPRAHWDNFRFPFQHPPLDSVVDPNPKPLSHSFRLKFQPSLQRDLRILKEIRSNQAAGF